MQQARKLRENAARCIRLSHSLSDPVDVAKLESIAAEDNQAATEIECAAGDGFARWADPRLLTEIETRLAEIGLPSRAMIVEVTDPR